jgi:SAM-dependent methyltransferase
VHNEHEYRAANRANWNDRAEIHLESAFYDVEGWLRAQPGPRQREIDALGDVAGLRLIHLQCHFGLDTLAFARAGAMVTGLDFSPVAIDSARQLAARAGLADRSTFVCADVYDAAATLEGAAYDIVYVSLGALCWLPDVDRWAAVVGALAAPGGRLYLHDVHPLAWTLSDDDLSFAYTYFEEGAPFIDDSDKTYTDASRPVEHTRSYEWNHSLGEIVTALVAHGLRITMLSEHDWTVWQRWPWLVEVGPQQWTMPPGTPRIPLTFTLLADRESGADRPAGPGGVPSADRVLPPETP